MPTTNTIAYGSQSAVTITLAALGSSSSFLAGRQSAVVVNTSAFALDYLVSGQVTVGTTPTVNTEIRAYIFAPVGTSYSLPDVFGTSDAAVTVTSAGVGQGFLRYGVTMNVDTTTSDRPYPFGPFSVAQLFGGICPAKFGVFVAHNTGVNLNATGGNHFVVVQPINTING